MAESGKLDDTAICAGGVAGYAGLTPEERLARQKHAKTLGTSAVAVIFKDALQTEAEVSPLYWLREEACRLSK